MVVLALVSAPAVPAEVSAADWKLRLDEAVAALAADQPRQARRTLVKLTDEMVEHLGTGAQAAEALAWVQFYTSVADAQLGRRDDSLWYWHLAATLHPPLEGMDVTRFGALFAEIAAEGREERRKLLSAARGDGAGPDDDLPQDADAAADEHPDEASADEMEVTPPVAIKSDPPEYPYGARKLRVTGPLVVRVVIGDDGRITTPMVLEPLEAASLTYVALQKLREWRFEPALVDGAPVSVLYNLTVNFRIKD